MYSKRAHIAVFGFNRPTHLRNCLESLAKCNSFSDFEGTIFIDGPRNSDDEALVRETLKIANSFSQKYHFLVIQRESNLGLSSSIRNGIDYVFSKHQKIIVIEDDLLLDRHFLNFIDSSLDHYESSNGVSSISGYQYPLSIQLSDCVFLRGADCWGWGTWKDRWELANFDSEELMQKLIKAGNLEELDLDNSIYYSKMLQMNIEKKINSWAIPWHISMFLENKLCLYPPISLVSNEGGDGSGTHFEVSELYTQKLHNEQNINFKYPSKIIESTEFRDKLKIFYNSQRDENLIVRVKTFVISIFSRFQ